MSVLTETRPVSVYLAGKISKNDWMHQLFPGLRGGPWMGDHGQSLPISQYPIYPDAISGVNYSGPYFVAPRCFLWVTLLGGLSLHSAARRLFKVESDINGHPSRRRRAPAIYFVSPLSRLCSALENGNGILRSRAPWLVPRCGLSSAKASEPG
jgi:hypothetical protein